QADRVVQLVAAKRVAAHELGEPIGFVDGGRTNRAHFVQRDGNAARGGLPRGLGSGQPAADDSDHPKKMPRKREKTKPVSCRSDSCFRDFAASRYAAVSGSSSDRA